MSRAGFSATAKDSNGNFAKNQESRLADDSNILTVLHEHALISSTLGWQIEIAPGGSSDRTFSVIDPAGTPRFTVRISRPGLAERLCHEEQVLRELGDDRNDSADLAADTSRPYVPQSVVLIKDDALPEGQMLVHEHVPGKIMPALSLSPAAREHLGEGLAWIHRHPRTGYMIWPSLEIQYGSREELFRKRMDTLHRYQSVKILPGAMTAIARLNQADLPVAAGWGESTFGLLHGDLSPGNILWSENQVGLIDWEFTRDGDPAEDLAYFVNEQNLSIDAVSEIADGYIAAGGEPWAFARMPAWLPLVALDAALWWADYWIHQGVDPMEVPDVRGRMERATNLFSSSSLSEVEST